MLAKQSLYIEAQKALEESLRLNPRSHASWGNLGRLYFETGKNDLAIQAYQNGLQQAPGWAAGLASLAFVHWKNGQPQKAEACVTKALQIQPNQGLALQLRKLLATSP